jgi:autotransporter-associated beta strand protein
MVRKWLAERFGGRAARDSKRSQRGLSALTRRRPRFEPLEERLALATIGMGDGHLFCILGSDENVMVGGASMDGSDETPLYFQSTSGSSITLADDAADYFTLSGPSNSIATVKSGTTLDMDTVMVYASSANTGSFTFGDGTYTLPDFGAEIRVSQLGGEVSQVIFKSNVTTTGDSQTYLCAAVIDGDVTLEGAGVSFESTINGNDATANDRLTIDSSAALSISGTIGQTCALNYLSLSNSSGDVDLAATAIDGDGAELRLDLAASLTQSGVLSGAMDLTIVGGTVTLDQANTFTGDTTVQDGTLYLKCGSDAAIVGNLIVGDGSGEAASAQVLLDNDQLASTATLTTYADGLFNLDENSFQTIAGLTMTGGTVNVGINSTLTLAGDVTTSACDVEATISGQLSLGDATRTFTVADGDADNDLLVSARISNGGLIKTGAGTLKLNGVNSYAGATTINAGTLLVSNDSALGTTDGNTVVNAGATLALSGVTIDEELELGSTVGLWGTGNAESVLSGDILLTADSGIVADQTVSIVGVISDGSLGDGYGMQITSGWVYFMGANTYRGVTTVLDGELLLHCDSGVAIQGDVVIGDGTGDTQSAKLNELYADQMATTTEVTVYADGWYCLIGSAQTIASLTMTGGLLNGSGGTLTLTGDVTTTAADTAAQIETNLDLNGGTCTFTVADGDAESDLVISAVISNGGLAKAGDGTLELSGVNTFAGTVEIAAGMLLVTDDANLGAVPDVVTADAIVLAGGTLLVEATFTLDANRGIQLDESTDSVIETAADVTLSYDGTIAGAGTLYFDGEGTVSLGGVQSYTGDTTLAAGTLMVSGSLATSTLHVTGGTLTGGGSVSTVTATGGTIELDATLGTLRGTQLDALSGATFTFGIDTEGGALAAQSLLDLTGALTLGSALLVLDSTETYAPGESVILATADGGISGVFGNAIDGSRVQATSGQYFQIHITTTQITATVLEICASTPGAYDAATSTFTLRYTNDSGEADTTFAYGVAGAGWIATVGDWDGDGIQTVGLYDPVESVFYLRNSNTTGEADLSFAYGAPDAGWTPIVGDWNNDGIDTVGLYDPTTANWYLRNENSTGVADLSFGYGAPGSTWTPVVGDWNGNGTDTVGLYDATDAHWYLRNENSTGVADLTFGYGAPGSAWTPVTGDWTASGATTIGLYDADAATWFLRDSNTSGAANHEFTFGTAGDAVQAITGVWTMPLSAAAVDAVDLAALADEALSGIS